MDIHTLTRELQLDNGSKIVMLVADGLGGLPMQPGGLTELETAKTPHLDALASLGVQGASIPVKPGIAPGSGPGHLARVGYDLFMSLHGSGCLADKVNGFAEPPRLVAVLCTLCTICATERVTHQTVCLTIL